MAWTAPKTWDENELLTSDDMNTYVSANTADLDSRLQNLTVEDISDVDIDGVAEGDILVYDGTSWVHKPRTFSQFAIGTQSADATTTATTMTATTLSCSITPSKSTSKILVLVVQQFAASRDNNDDIYVTAGLFRGNTQLTTSLWGFQADYGSASDIDLYDTVSFMYLDEPGVTTATTYSTKIMSESGGSNTSITTKAKSTIFAIEVGT